MKPVYRTLATVALSAALALQAACGGGGSSDATTPSTDGGSTPAPTPGSPATHYTAMVSAVGQQRGVPVIARIGPQGGIVVSGDGQAVLEIPSGALATETEISMAPISAEMPRGVAAWRFGPDGLQFAQPATLRLRGLDAAQVAITALATQDVNGLWHAAERATPSAADEVAFRVPHFSDWSFYQQYTLSPERETLEVKQQLTLKAMFTPRRCLESTDVDCLLTPLVGNADVVRWAVNGVVGGNASVGTLSATSGGTVVYTAPAQVPSANPVAVSALINDPDVGQITLVANLRIEPAQVHWSGEITLSFSGLLVDHSGEAETRHQVSFSSTHAVDQTTVDAAGDDGAVAASLVMHVPTVDYLNQYHYKEPGLDVMSELASRQASGDFYDAEDVGYRPSLQVQVQADGTLRVPIGTLLAYLNVKGQRTVSSYDGTTGHTEVDRIALEWPVSIGPDMSNVPTGVQLRDPITDAPIGDLPGTFEGHRIPGAGEVWAGDTTLENVTLEFDGTPITGTLNARWQFSRMPP